MKAYNLRVLVTAVLLVFLPATTIPVPVTAQAPLAAADFDCNTTTGIPAIECDALVALYNSTNGPGWTNHSGWLVTGTPCSWYGVACSAERITRVDLLFNQLTGSIPPELGNLVNVRAADSTLSFAVPVQPRRVPAPGAMQSRGPSSIGYAPGFLGPTVRDGIPLARRQALTST
jgi:hypothetical protein